MKHSSSGDLPKKPRPDFPLYVHVTGRWAKKVRGKLHYFGSTADDPKGEKAILRWLDVKDELLTGRIPRKRESYLSIADLANEFLVFKEQLRDGGELSPRTFKRLHDACKCLVDYFGKDRAADDIMPEDFRDFRNALSQRWGAVALGNEIGMIRQIFKYGLDNELLSKKTVFGTAFKKPSAAVLRRERAETGPRHFSASQIRSILEKAKPHVQAMILLGINGGMGNTDLAHLPIAAIDAGWLNYPRQKTSIDRRIPLWPETIEAIRKTLLSRREPKDPADAKLLFIGPRGSNYIDQNRGTQITKAFNLARKKAGVTGRTFYDLRRTFQTIAENVRDLAAVQAIMGHAPAKNDMSATYRQAIDDARLRAVVGVVRAWLFPPEIKKTVSLPGAAGEFGETV